MLISMLLAAAAPVAAGPVDAKPLVCKVVKDHPLKSRRSIACGTAEEWQAFHQAYRAAVQKEERRALAQSSAYAGVGSGF